MRRFLKRWMMPLIILVLVIVVFCVLAGVGGKYDNQFDPDYTCYQIIFGVKTNWGEMFGTNPLGIIAFILILAGTVLAFANFKKRNIVVCAIFTLAALFVLLMPYTVTLSESSKNLIKALGDADGKMTALACIYVSFALLLVTACTAFLSDFISKKIVVAKTK